MSSPESEFRIEEADLGPFGFIDIGYCRTKETLLLGHSEKDFSVGCLLLDDDESLVAYYGNPKYDDDELNNLFLARLSSWEEGTLFAIQLVEDWIESIKARQVKLPVLLTEYNAQVPEPKAFTHANGDSLGNVDNQISQLKMQRLRNSGIYVPVREIIRLAQ